MDDKSQPKSYYTPAYDGSPAGYADNGTSSFSVSAPNGEAVAVTSSINYG